MPGTVYAAMGERKRLAKAELLMELAVHAQTHVVMLQGTGVTRFENWPADDPMVRIARIYALTPKELAKLMEGLANDLEARALRCGYDEHWEEEA